jgi:hypothetical protein
MPVNNPKEEREVQWGNKTGTARGWERYRSSTFLEVIGAKIDRALQANHLIQKLKLREYSAYELEKLREDGLDSLIDAQNYLAELIRRCQSNGNYFDNQEMP